MIKDRKRKTRTTTCRNEKNLPNFNLLFWWRKGWWCKLRKGMKSMKRHLKLVKKKVFLKRDYGSKDKYSVLKKIKILESLVYYTVCSTILFVNPTTKWWIYSLTQTGSWNFFIPWDIPASSPFPGNFIFHSIPHITVSHARNERRRRSLKLGQREEPSFPRKPLFSSSDDNIM